MNTGNFLVLIVLLSAMHQGPATYQALTCVEPEVGYFLGFAQFITGTEVQKLCPSRADLARLYGYEVFCTLLAVVVTLLLEILPLIGKGLNRKMFLLVAGFQEWRKAPTRCRHCGTAPCQVNRRCLWKPSGPGKKKNENTAKRANAMMLFNCGLEVMVMSRDLPKDDLYWEWKYRQPFGEEDLPLFPLCIQRQLDYWYPLPD